VTSSQTASLEKFGSLFSDQATGAILVHGGDDNVSRGKVTALPVRTLIPHLRELEAALP
jgi:hypothetical protein